MEYSSRSRDRRIREAHSRDWMRAFREALDGYPAEPLASPEYEDGYRDGLRWKDEVPDGTTR